MNAIQTCTAVTNHSYANRRKISLIYLPKLDCGDPAVADSARSSTILDAAIIHSGSPLTPEASASVEAEQAVEECHRQHMTARSRDSVAGAWPLHEALDSL